MIHCQHSSPKKARPAIANRIFTTHHLKLNRCLKLHHKYFKVGRLELILKPTPRSVGLYHRRHAFLTHQFGTKEVLALGQKAINVDLNNLVKTN